MERRILIGIGAAIVLILGLLPAAGRAEPFWDFYYGAMEIADDDVSASTQVVSIFGPGPVTHISKNVSYDTANVFGMRGGYWFEGVPWLALAFDLSYFEANSPGVDIRLLPMTGLLMLRHGLAVDGRYPRGRLQPYVGVGLSYAFADISVDFSPELPESADGYGSATGPVLCAGLDWQLTPNVGVFAEYRYQQLDVDIDDSNDSFLVFGSQVINDVNADIKTTGILAGLSFRY